MNYLKGFSYALLNRKRTICYTKNNAYHFIGFFNSEILRAYFVIRVVDFHSETVIAKANAMGDLNATRLLQGMLNTVESCATQVPWLSERQICLTACTKYWTHLR